MCEEAGIKKPDFIEMDSAIRTNFYRLNYKSDQKSDHDLELLNFILNYCKTLKSLRKIMEKFEFKHKTNFRNKYISPLIEKDKLSLTISDKPFSKNQLRIASGINKKIENSNFLMVMTKR